MSSSGDKALHLMPVFWALVDDNGFREGMDGRRFGWLDERITRYMHGLENGDILAGHDVVV